MLRPTTRVQLVAVVAVFAAAGVGTALVSATASEAPAESLASATQRAISGSGISPSSRLASGTTPSGARYELSRIEFPGQRYCVRVSVGEGMAQGCLGLPGQGGGFNPVEFFMGEDVFVVGLMDDLSERLEVRRLDQPGFTTSRGHSDLGDVRIAHAVMRAPQATLPKNDRGLPSPPSLAVTAVDASGRERGRASVPGEVDSEPVEAAAALR